MKNFTFKEIKTFILLVAVLLTAQFVSSQDEEFVRQEYTPTAPACIYYADDYRGPHSTLRSQAVANNMSRGTACSTFIVNYNGFTPEAEAAFQFAVDIWANSIESPQPIRINANFTALGPGVLGSAGPTNFLTSNAPGTVPSTFYPQALWEKLEDEDTDELFGAGESVDINCNFSSTFNFYFGTDANPPNGQFDFVSVVLHELGHGLGFVGFARVDGSSGTQEGAIRQTGSPRPSIYDTFIENGSGDAILSFADPSTDLLAQLEGNDLFCNGPLTVIENGGTPARTFAPSTFNSGSSYSHWNEGTYLAGDINSLMTPQIGPGEANHDPGPITLKFFEDMGWSLCASLSTEEFEISNIDVNPNPFTNELTLTFANSISGTFDIDLLDINGRVVKRFTENSQGGTINIKDLEDLDNALYFLKITNLESGRSVTQKLIKQ